MSNTPARLWQNPERMPRVASHEARRLQSPLVGPSNLIRFFFPS
jgi:hypothetical protein